MRGDHVALDHSDVAAAYDVQTIAVVSGCTDVVCLGLDHGFRR